MSKGYTATYMRKIVRERIKPLNKRIKELEKERNELLTMQAALLQIIHDYETGEGLDEAEFTTLEFMEQYIKEHPIEKHETG